MICEYAEDGHQRLLAAVLDDGRVQLWESESSAVRRQLTPPSHLSMRPTCLAWHHRPSAEPVLLAVGSDSGVILVWDVQSVALLHTIRAHTQRVNHLLFDSAGEQLYSCSDDGQVLVWSPASGKQFRELKKGKVAASRLALSPDERHMLLGATSIKLMRVDKWKRVCQLQGHADAVKCLRFSPDGRFALSSASDRHASLWRLLYSKPEADADADANLCLATLSFEAAVEQLDFMQTPPAGWCIFFVLCADGKLSVWRIPESAFSGKKKQKQPARPFSLPPPCCSLRVAADSSGSEAAGPHADSQRILQATFTAHDEILVAYGRQVRPAFSRCKFLQPDGEPVRSLLLPRVQEGLLAAAGESSPSASTKRKREKEQILGAADMVLSNAQRRRIAPAANGTAELEKAPDATDGTARSSSKAKATVAATLPPPLSADAQAALAEAAAAAASAAEAERAEADNETRPSFGARLAASAAPESQPSKEPRKRASTASQERAVGRLQKPPRSASARTQAGDDDANDPDPVPDSDANAASVATIVQALQNGDAAMLDHALQVQDVNVITATVARLPVTSVMPFLDAVLVRIQGKPNRVAALASWLRALLSTHAGFFMSCPQLLPMLTPLYQLIDERLSVFKPLLKLVGRMQILQSQIASQAASGRLEGSEAQASGPLLTFDEAAEEEAAAATAEAGEDDLDDDEDEDDEDEDEEEDGEDDDDDDDDHDDDDDGNDDDDFDDEDDFGL